MKTTCAHQSQRSNVGAIGAEMTVAEKLQACFFRRTYLVHALEQAHVIQFPPRHQKGRQLVAQRRRELRQDGLWRYDEMER